LKKKHSDDNQNFDENHSGIIGKKVFDSTQDDLESPAYFRMRK